MHSYRVSSRHTGTKKQAQSEAWLTAVSGVWPCRDYSLPSSSRLDSDLWLALKEMRPSRSRSASSITARMSSSLTCSRGASKLEHPGTARQGYIYAWAQAVRAIVVFRGGNTGYSLQPLQQLRCSSYSTAALED